MPDIAHRRVGIMQSGLQIDNITLPCVHSVTFIRYGRYVTYLAKRKRMLRFQVGLEPYRVMSNVTH